MQNDFSVIWPIARINFLATTGRCSPGMRTQKQRQPCCASCYVGRGMHGTTGDGNGTATRWQHTSIGYALTAILKKALALRWRREHSEIFLSLARYSSVFGNHPVDPPLWKLRCFTLRKTSPTRATVVTGSAPPRTILPARKTRNTVLRFALCPLSERVSASGGTKTGKNSGARFIPGELPSA